MAAGTLHSGSVEAGVDRSFCKQVLKTQWGLVAEQRAPYIAVLVDRSFCKQVLKTQWGLVAEQRAPYIAVL